MRRFTVEGLSRALGSLVDRSFPRVQVEGEIAQVQTPASGHCFLTLREGRAQLGAVIWKSTYQGLVHPPKPGERVVCTGRVGLFAPQGKLQLYVNTVRPVGDGELARRIEAIKARLDADGLLDPRRRRPLPSFPRVIGVATSLTGAALQDFLRVSQRRWPARILVAGCTVQGPEAAGSVVRALELLFDDGRAEVVVVTRGGGSKLDLMPFHDETLARWIATAPVPIVSAVGHEIDTSIADLVADRSAPTPSAAAMVVLPDAEELRRRAHDAERRLQRAMARRLARHRERLEGLRRRLRHPAERLQAARGRRDELVVRLHRAMRRQLGDARRRLEHTERGLRALSPVGVLDRGYALVSREDGQLVRSPEEVPAGTPLTVRVAHGSFAATSARAELDSEPEAP
jgi:exodeoxyribonuclease VII large subunit